MVNLCRWSRFSCSVQLLPMPHSNASQLHYSCARLAPKPQPPSVQLLEPTLRLAPSKWHPPTHHQVPPTQKSNRRSAQLLQRNAKLQESREFVELQNSGERYGASGIRETSRIRGTPKTCWAPEKCDPPHGLRVAWPPSVRLRGCYDTISTSQRHEGSAKCRSTQPWQRGRSLFDGSTNFFARTLAPSPSLPHSVAFWLHRP